MASVHLLGGLALAAPRHRLDDLLELLDGDGGGEALAARLALHYQLRRQALHRGSGVSGLIGGWLGVGVSGGLVGTLPPATGCRATLWLPPTACFWKSWSWRCTFSCCTCCGLPWG